MHWRSIIWTFNSSDLVQKAILSRLSVLVILSFSSLFPLTAWEILSNASRDMNLRLKRLRLYSGWQIMFMILRTVWKSEVISKTGRKQWSKYSKPVLGRRRLCWMKEGKGSSQNQTGEVWGGGVPNWSDSYWWLDPNRIGFTRSWGREMSRKRCTS